MFMTMITMLMVRLVAIASLGLGPSMELNPSEKRLHPGQRQRRQASVVMIGADGVNPCAESQKKAAFAEVHVIQQEHPVRRWFERR